MLMQTAAHVAGAAYFYQMKDLCIDENNNSSAILKSNKVSLTIYFHALFNVLSITVK